MLKLITTVALAIVLTGCAGFVQTSSTTFQGPNHEMRGKIIVMPIDKSQESSLEFSSVSNYLARKLAIKGYDTALSLDDAQFMAFITYGIDSGTTSVSSVPIYGQTGGGTSYTTGTVTNSYGRTGTYSGTTTTMPTYGMVGAVPVRSTEYKRRVNIDIWRRDVTPIKVYELKGLSSGSCGNINAILFNIIDGMFLNFPGESGRSKTVNVDWDGSC